IYHSCGSRKPFASITTTCTSSFIPYKSKFSQSGKAGNSSLNNFCQSIYTFFRYSSSNEASLKPSSSNSSDSSLTHRPSLHSAELCHKPDGSGSDPTSHEPKNTSIFLSSLSFISLYVLNSISCPDANSVFKPTSSQFCIIACVRPSKAAGPA